MAPSAFSPVQRVVPFGVMFGAAVDPYQVLFDPAGLAADHGTMYLVKLQEAILSMPSPE